MQRTFADMAEQGAFRKELEDMLRQGAAEQALDRARARLRDIAAADPLMAKRALDTRVEHISITGWEKLAARIRSAEEHSEEMITALGIDFSWPGHFATSMKDGKAVLDFDAQGGFAPVLETNYYGDIHAYKVLSPKGEMDLRREFRFSTANREEILQAYSSYGSAWQGGFIDIDNLIGVKGMDPIYGAIQTSESRDSDNVEGDAYLLAACTSAILLHLAVKRTIEARGLPKPMAVLVGSNEDFPFFNAPVVSIDEALPYVRPAERKPSSERPRERPAREEQQRDKRRNERINAERFEQQRPAAGQGDPDELAAIARVAERQLSRVRKRKDILPALGTVGLFALTQFLGKRK